MRYDYLQGAKPIRKTKKWLLALPLIGLIAGGYLLVNAFAPSLPVIDGRAPDATAQKLVQQKPGDNGDRLYIPQINVDVAIVTGENERILEKGAWHRNPQNGDPTKGGNFVLSAHRFLLGTTPLETKAKSPFYHIDKLAIDDELFVDYDGKRYVYKVDKKYRVDRTAVEIEAPSKDSKLTLYSCDLRGEKAGREVIEAKPVGTVAYNGGKPFIQPNAN